MEASTAKEESTKVLPFLALKADDLLAPSLRALSPTKICRAEQGFRNDGNASLERAKLRCTHTNLLNLSNMASQNEGIDEPDLERLNRAR